MAKKEEYDWLSDPFDEKKEAEEREQAQMTGCSRLGVLLALFAVVVILVGIAFMACSVMSLGSSIA